MGPNRNHVKPMVVNVTAKVVPSYDRLAETVRRWYSHPNTTRHDVVLRRRVANLQQHDPADFSAMVSGAQRFDGRDSIVKEKNRCSQASISFIGAPIHDWPQVDEPSCMNFIA